jgi:hypothetical protein
LGISWFPSFFYIVNIPTLINVNIICPYQAGLAQDLMAKYHNNGSIVQELINGKLISGKWKEHPEFPGNADSRPCGGS